MSFNLTAGNPRAHRIRVYFEGETTVYEGMPVCYNYDTTTNWWGGSMTLGAVTETNTTVEGSQNEGKYIRVEIPSAANLVHFAGVVAKGSPLIGKTGPGAIDIYVPNGAIVPVRCDVDTTVGVTILAITSGEEEFGFLVADSRPVAIAMETETGLDGTADITLAKLDPNMFSFNYGTSAAVYSETPGTYPVNYQYVKFTSAAPTVGFIQDNRLLYNGTMTAGQLTVENIYLHFTGTNSSAGTAYIRGVVCGLHLDGCTLTSASSVYCGCMAQVGGAPASFTQCSKVCALWVDAALVTNPTIGTSSAVYVSENSGTGVLDTVFDFKTPRTDYFAIFSGNEGIGANRFIYAMTGDHTTGATDRALRCLIGDTTYYIPLFDTLAA